jgi:glycosyltransferase involved in cell wall biosynthesis
MKKKLVLITAHFPYGTSETFLESELPILAQNFESIDILTFNTIGNKREIPINCFVSEIKLNTKPLLAYLGVFSIIFWKEIFIIKRIYKKNISIGILKTMLISLMRGNAIARFISSYNPEEKQDSIYYSYWCDDSALALAIYNKKNHNQISTVTRTHGWDVYFEVSDYNYLPFRHFIHENLSHIFPISEKGKIYIEETWKVKGKITVCKLGVNGPHFDKLSVRKDNGNTSPPPLSPSKGGIDDRNTFTIVSCSNLIPLKRVHLIIEALSLLQSKRIHWVHFGDGPESTKLKNLADKKLSGNISFQFNGRVENKEVLNFYKTNSPHLFINVSSSEGIPVSIMEAMSFGIPCIATNVGGNNEIVKNNFNGILLNTNPSIDEIAQVIKSLYTKTQTEYKVLSEKAYETWEKEYNAMKNFSLFNQLLQ